MGISAKVKINGQPLTKNLRLSGSNIVEQLITGQIKAEDLRRSTTFEQLGSLGGDQVTRLAGFNLTKDILVAEREESMAVAKYFQILVSNTPIDEKYRYIGKVYTADGLNLRLSESQRAKWKELSKQRQKELKKGTAAGDSNAEKLQKQIDDITQNPEEETTERIHYPDKDSVRGDWVLIFRGQRFKAFETSRNCGADITFSKELFENVDDFSSVTKIAIAIHNATSDSEVGGGFKVVNDNPRAAMLEYGHYEVENSTPKIGSRYAHGITNKHTYQAPKGFYRLTNALWNDIARDAKTGRYQKHIEEWINKDLRNFNVADIDTDVMKKLLKKKTVSTDEINLKKLTKGKVK